MTWYNVSRKMHWTYHNMIATVRRCLYMYIYSKLNLEITGNLYWLTAFLIKHYPLKICMMCRWWNEWGFRPLLCAYRLSWARNLLRMMRRMIWHCPPDTWFEIRAPAVWGRARYLSVTEAPHNFGSLRVGGEEIFCFFKTWKARVGFEPAISDFQSTQL